MSETTNKNGSWGKMRPETLRILLKAFCDGQETRVNIVSWVCGLIRTANNIPDRERKDVAEWLEANGYTVESLQDVYTVQYTHEECATANGCDVRASKRQRQWLLDSKVLITVQPGKKGYPGLFILAPVSVSSSVTESQKTVSSSVTENKNRVSCNNVFGDIDPEIGCQAQRADLGKNSLSRIIQNNPEASFECKRCGAHEGTHLPTGMIECNSCGSVNNP